MTNPAHPDTDGLQQLVVDELNRIERDWARLNGNYSPSTTVVPVSEVRTALNAIAAALAATEAAPLDEERLARALHEAQCEWMCSHDAITAGTDETGTQHMVADWWHGEARRIVLAYRDAR